MYNMLAWWLELENQFKYRFQTLGNLLRDGCFSYCTLYSTTDVMYTVRVTWIRISDPRSLRSWYVHQRNRRIHSGHGFMGSLRVSEAFYIAQ